MQTDPDSYMIRVMHVKNANGEAKTLQFPLRLDLDRPKRARTTFTIEQLKQLDDAYRTNGYVTGVKRAKLAEQLRLSDTQVKVWFQNRRTKDRKKKNVSDDEDRPHQSQQNNNTDSTPSPISIEVHQQNQLQFIPSSSIPHSSSSFLTSPLFPLTDLSLGTSSLFSFSFPQSLLPNPIYRSNNV